MAEETCEEIIQELDEMPSDTVTDVDLIPDQTPTADMGEDVG